MTRREELAQARKRAREWDQRSLRFLLGLVDELAVALRGAADYALHAETCAYVIHGQDCDCGFQRRETAINRLLSELGPDA